MKDSFIEQTARAIIDTIRWEELSRTTLVLPSHRAGLELKEALLRLQQERQAQVIWAPQVQTLPQLQDSLSPLYAEDELFTIVRLYRHYLRLYEGEKTMPLDVFYGWGRQLLADFTNIDASMKPEEVPNFFANTIAAHELGEWRLDEEVEARLRSLLSGGAQDPMREGSIKHQYEQLWHRMDDLYQALNEEMAAEQKGYAGMRQRAIITCWDDETIQQKIAGRTYVFVGFNYLLPVECELMQLMKQAVKTLFYWDYRPDFKTNTKAFSFAKKNAELLGNNNPSPVTHNPSPITIISCVSRESQAQYVHQWLKDNYTHKGQRVGVVICDETMLEPVIYTLPALQLPGSDEVEPVNITKGFPLRNTHMYARVLGWLSEHQKGRGEECITTDFIDEFIAKVLDQSPITGNPSPITDTPSPITPESLSWQELLILESEYQVRKIANQLRLLVSNGLGDVPFTHKLFRLLMRRMMESVTMPFHGEPVTDVQVMGVLETRLLDFDKLLILNVEEGVLPQKQMDISFIPFYLRKVYHMQTSDERATVYAYNFFRLLSRAGHTTLMFASAETSEGGKGMSRFIMQLLVSPEFIVEKRRLEEHSALQTIENDDLIAASLASLLTKNDKGQLVRSDGKRFRLSPSALNTFITCRRSFYLQYILGLHPTEDEEVLFAPNTMGTFVHYSMEYLYKTYLRCDNTTPVKVSPEEIEAIRTDEKRIQEALDDAYRRMNEEAGEEKYIPAFHTSENVVIKGYVDNILVRDREDAKIGLKLYRLEYNSLFPVEVEGVGEILSGGKIDRLDIFGPEGQEHLRVVDYKSGGYNDKTHEKKMSATWEDMMEDEQKGYVRQTLIYSHAVAHNDPTNLPIEPHLYFCRRKLTEIETTIDVAAQTVSDYAQIEDSFYHALQTKMKEVLTATEFPQCEPDKCSSFCPFAELCGRKS